MASKIFDFHPENWGDDPIWRSYFSDGLVQPPPHSWDPPKDSNPCSWRGIFVRVTIHIKEPFLQVSSKNHLLTVRVFVSIELEKKHVGSIRLKNLSVVVQIFVFFLMLQLTLPDPHSSKKRIVKPEGLALCCWSFLTLDALWCHSQPHLEPGVSNKNPQALKVWCL